MPAPPAASWTECRLRVETVTPLPNGRVNITMQQPAWSMHSRAYGQALPLPVSAANIFAALSPGRYYLSSASRTVFYVPRAGEDMGAANYVVPTLDVLMALRGAAPGAGAVRYIDFEAIQFSFAGWLAPNGGLGYVDMQSGYRLVDPAADPNNDDLWVPVPGNVQLHFTENVTFVNCSFVGLGATALSISDASQSVAVLGSTFRDVSCAGVAVGQVSDVNTTDGSRVNGYFRVEDK